MTGDNDDEIYDLSVDTLTSVQNAGDTAVSNILPIVMSVTSSERHTDILALRASGLNWKISYYDNIVGAPIPVGLLALGRMPALSTLSQYRGLRYEPAMLQTYDGSRKK